MDLKEKVLKKYNFNKRLENNNKNSIIELMIDLFSEEVLKTHKIIILKKLLNNYLIIPTLFNYFKKHNKSLGIIIDNLDLSTDLEAMIVLYVILQELKIPENKYENLSENIKKNIHKKIRIDLMEFLFYFSIKEKLSLKDLIECVDTDQYKSSNVSIFLNSSKEELISFEDYNEKIINVDLSKSLNKENQLHVENAITYLINRNQYTLDDNSVYHNKNFLFEFVDFNNINLLDKIIENDYQEIKLYFSPPESRIIFFNKEKYPDYRVMPSLDLSSNKMMTMKQKLEFMENVLTSNTFDLREDNIRPDIIYFVKNLTLIQLEGYPNIFKHTMSEYIQNYKVNNTISYSGDKERLSFEDYKKTKESVSNYINIDNKRDFNVLIKYIKTQTNKNLITDYKIIQIINNIRNQKILKKTLNDCYDDSYLIELVLFQSAKIQYEDYEVYENVFVSYLQNILNYVWGVLESKKDKKLISKFYYSYSYFSRDSVKIQQYVLENHKDFFKRGMSEYLLELFKGNNKISEEEYQWYILEKIKGGDTHSKVIEKLSNVEEQLKELSPMKEFSIRFDNYINENIPELNKNNKIFKLFDDLMIDLLSNEKILKSLISENRYSEKYNKRQVEFFKDLISEKESTYVWSEIKEIAKELKIPISSMLKEELYYTSEESIESLFEI